MKLTKYHHHHMSGCGKLKGGKVHVPRPGATLPVLDFSFLLEETVFSALATTQNVAVPERFRRFRLPGGHDGVPHS